jgi:hypothetical protein
MDLMALAAVVFGKAILSILPLPVFGLFGFLKWKRHYGPESSMIGYYLRYTSGKRATDDPWPIFTIKMVVFLIWFMVVTPLVA